MDERDLRQRDSMAFPTRQQIDVETPVNFGQDIVYFHFLTRRTSPHSGLHFCLLKDCKALALHGRAGQ